MREKDGPTYAEVISMRWRRPDQKTSTACDKKGRPVKSMTSQRMTSQGMTSQRMTSQRMMSQRITSKKMTSQRKTSQRMTSQRMTSKGMTSQRRTSQRTTSQNMTSQRMTSQRRRSQRMTSQLTALTVILLLTAVQRSSSTAANNVKHLPDDIENKTVLQEINFKHASGSSEPLKHASGSSEPLKHASGSSEPLKHASGSSEAMVNGLTKSRRDSEEYVIDGRGVVPINEWKSYQQVAATNMSAFDGVILTHRQKAENSDTRTHLDEIRFDGTSFDEGNLVEKRLHRDEKHLDERFFNKRRFGERRAVSPEVEEKLFDTLYIDRTYTEDTSSVIRSDNSVQKLLVKRSISDIEEDARTTVGPWNDDKDNMDVVRNLNAVITDDDASSKKIKNHIVATTQTAFNAQLQDNTSTNADVATEFPRKKSGLSTIFSRDLTTTQLMSRSQSKDLGCRFGMNERRLLPISDHTYDRVTCFWCYVFVPAHRKKQGLKLDFANHKFLHNNQSYTFDHNDGTIWQIVKESMIDDLEAGKLENCCKEAIQCCDTMLLENPSPSPDGDCPPTWDGWICVPQPAPVQHDVPIQCPVHAYTGYPECYMTGHKRCGEGGVWQTNNGYEYTNYTGCSMEDFHELNYIWEVTMHSISLAALLPALLVLCCYRPLQLPRFHMHIHFFVALSLRAVCKILELTIIKMPENKNVSTILEDNGPACKVLVTLAKVSLLAVWGWMLAESVFLHRLISRPFSRVTTILPYVAGAWGGAAVLGAVWAVCRGLLEDFQCWLGDHKGDALQLHLLTDIPILITLLVNIGLLIDMGRIMYLQLRGRNADQSDVNKRAVKGTLFLVPMFGAQFLVTAVAPIGVQCVWLQGYILISTAMSGLQGFYITIFYCYNNKEVQKQLRQTTMRLQHRLCPSSLEGASGPSGRRWGDSSAVDPHTTMSTVMSESSTARGDDGTMVEMQPLRG